MRWGVWETWGCRGSLKYDLRGVSNGLQGLPVTTTPRVP